MKTVWKRTAKGNVMLSYRGLRAVVFSVRCPARYGSPDYIMHSYNILGLPSGTVWGLRFRLEADAGNAAAQELARHCPMQDFQRFEEFQNACLADVTEDELIAGIRNLENQIAMMQDNLRDEGVDANSILHTIEDVRHSIRGMQHSLELKTRALVQAQEEKSVWDRAKRY
jgi:hypothetical protein